MPGPSGDVLGGLGTVGAAYFEIAADDDPLVRGLASAVADAKAAVAEGSGDIEIGLKLDASFASVVAQIEALKASMAHWGGEPAEWLELRSDVYAATQGLRSFTAEALVAGAAASAAGDQAAGAARDFAAMDAARGMSGAGGGDFGGGIAAAEAAAFGFGGGGGGPRRALPWGARFLMPTTAAGWLAFHINPTVTEIAGLAQAIAGLAAGVGTIMGIGAALVYVSVQAGRLREAITGQAPAIDLYINTLQAHFQALGNSIKQSLTGPGQDGLAILSGGIIQISDQVAGMFKSLLSSAGGQQFLGFLISQVHLWVGVVGQLFSGIGTSFMRFWTEMQPVALAFVHGIGGLISSLLHTAGDVIGPISKIAAPGILQFFGAVGHLVAAWEPLMAGFEHAFLGVMQLTNAIVAGLIPATQALSPIIGAVSGTVSIFAHGLSFVAPALVQLASPFLVAVGASRLFSAGMSGVGNVLAMASARLASAGPAFAGMAESVGAAAGTLMFFGKSAVAAVGWIAGITTAIALLTGVVDRARANQFGAMWAQQSAGLGPGGLANLANRQFSVVNTAATEGIGAGIGGAAGTGLGALLGGGPGAWLGARLGSLLGAGVGGLLAHLGIGVHQQQSFLSLLPQQQQADTLQAFADNWKSLTQAQRENATQAIASAKQGALFAMDLNTVRANTEAARQALETWNEALSQRSVPSMAAATQGVKLFAQATGQSIPTLVNAAQQAGDSTQKQIQMIQQQEQAWYTFRDSLATALGSGSSALQAFQSSVKNFSATNTVNLGNVNTFLQGFIQKQRGVLEAVHILSQMGPKGKEAGIAVAQLGVSWSGLDQGIIQGSKGTRDSFVNLMSQIDTISQKGADKMTRELVGGVHKIAAEIHTLIDAVNNLSAAIQGIHDKHVQITIDTKILGPGATGISGFINAAISGHLPPGSPTRSTGLAGLPGLAGTGPVAPTHRRQHGGWITEPVYGVGLHSGDAWSFAETGPEYVNPARRRSARSGGAGLDYEKLGQAVAAALHGTAVEVDGFKIGQLADRRRAVMR